MQKTPAPVGVDPTPNINKQLTDLPGVAAQKRASQESKQLQNGINSSSAQKNAAVTNQILDANLERMTSPDPEHIKAMEEMLELKKRQEQI